MKTLLLNSVVNCLKSKNVQAINQCIFTSFVVTSINTFTMSHLSCPHHLTSICPILMLQIFCSCFQLWFLWLQWIMCCQKVIVWVKDAFNLSFLKAILNLKVKIVTKMIYGLKQNPLDFLIINCVHVKLSKFLLCWAFSLIKYRLCGMLGS